MPDGFKAIKDKSKTKQSDLIASLQKKSTVTNKELSELIIILIEKLSK